jgi:SET domain-containing protein 6
MKATKFIQTGEEIFNHYGLLPRADLIRQYGYITPNYAPYDEVEISLLAFIVEAERSLSIPRTDGIWEKVDLPNEFPLARPGQNKPSLEDITEDLPILRISDRFNKSESEKIDWLTLVLQTRLSEYSTSLEDDIRLVEKITENSRLSIALQIRIGEKEILHNWIENVKFLRELIDIDRPGKRLKEG